MSEPIRVLHVDDDQAFVDMAATFLERADERFTVETVTRVDEALDRLDDDVDCIVSDYDMPGRTGIEFLEDIRERDPDLPFILYTGKGSESVASDAISAGVTDYLQKGAGTDQYTLLANRIANAVAGRRSAEQAERRRHRLEQVLKTVPSCVVRLNREGDFLFANERAVEVLGLEQSAVTDRAYNDPEWRIRDLDGDPIPDGELPFEQVRRSGEPVYDCYHTIEWPDGTRKTLQVNGAPLFDADGDVESVVFAISDRTGREQARRTIARLEALFEHSPDMITVHDAEGTIVDANPQLYETTGLDESAIVGEKVWDLDESADPEQSKALWDRMEPGDRERFEGRYRGCDGSAIPVEIHLRRMDLSGTNRFVAISHEISERAERERELEVTRRRLEAILENTTTPMFMKDDEGRYIFVNRGYRELFGVDDEAVVGHTDHEIHPAAMVDVVRENDRVVIEQGKWIEAEERITVEGEERMFLATKVPIYDTGDRADPDDPVGLFGVASDITDLKRRERELQRERDRLEEFAEIVSHDLRSPLTVASGRLELAREECDSDHLDGIGDALDRGQALIDDLLTLAREGDDIDDSVPVSLPQLIEDCWETTETAGARLVVETDRTIRADRTRLKQLLENLFRNSVEHGSTESRPEAGDSVEHGSTDNRRAERAGDSVEHGSAETVEADGARKRGVTVTVGDVDGGFYVADDGPGVPEDDREKVFDSGYSTAGSTGLGLRIVERVTEAHGWSVRAIESDGGGARFEITGVETA